MPHGPVLCDSDSSALVPSPGGTLRVNSSPREAKQPARELKPQPRPREYCALTAQSKSASIDFSRVKSTRKEGYGLDLPPKAALSTMKRGSYLQNQGTRAEMRAAYLSGQRRHGIRGQRPRSALRLLRHALQEERSGVRLLLQPRAGCGRGRGRGTRGRRQRRLLQVVEQGRLPRRGGHRGHLRGPRLRDEM